MRFHARVWRRTLRLEAAGLSGVQIRRFISRVVLKWSIVVKRLKSPPVKVVHLARSVIFSFLHLNTAEYFVLAVPVSKCSAHVRDGSSKPNKSCVFLNKYFALLICLMNFYSLISNYFKNCSVKLSFGYRLCFVVFSYFHLLASLLLLLAFT